MGSNASLLAVMIAGHRLETTKVSSLNQKPLFFLRMLAVAGRYVPDAIAGTDWDNAHYRARTWRYIDKLPLFMSLIRGSRLGAFGVKRRRKKSGVTGSLVDWLVGRSATYGFAAIRAWNRLASTDLRWTALCGLPSAGGARRSSLYTAHLQTHPGSRAYAGFGQAGRVTT